MAEINRAVKGTNDILPDISHNWQFVENKMLETAALYGFKEIRVPVFEHTEVFLRSVGDTTDVVQKEMYTFDDKGGRSITLRPELTAGVIRSAIENGLVNAALPAKVCYIGGCYRYEKPQAGRLREFHQFGVDAFGAGTAIQDAEVISLAYTYLNYLGIDNVALEINSIGCPECRKKYTEALKEYFENKKGELCETCLSRLDRNPMRILDCKSPVCSKIAEGAPVVLDFICDDCREHFESLQKYLDTMGIAYTVNPQIVRGLDYYTRTVFEFISKYEKTNGLVVCGGGRYDGLIEELGGNPLPACGFGMGLERLVLIMEGAGIPFPEAPKYNLSIVTAGENAVLKALEIASDLRSEGYSVSVDTVGRSIKAQMKYSNKVGAEYTVVLGDNELEENKAKLKNMSDGTENEISLENFSEEFFGAVVKDSMDGIADASFSGMNPEDLNNLFKL